MKLNNFLKIIFIIDAIIAIGFGIYSWISPYETFGTLVSITESNESIVLALLSSLSILYILLGLVCVIGYKATYPVPLWIGALMILRHSWIGLMKVSDIGKEWLIGNPYPDIIIHGTFVLAYLLGIYITVRNKKATS